MHRSRAVVRRHQPSVVRVRTSGRWRGFLSVQPRRTIHLRAFATLAGTFAASELRCFPDNDNLNEAFDCGGSFETRARVLDDRFGRPRRLDALIDPKVAYQTEIECPSLQYVFNMPRSVDPMIDRSWISESGVGSETQTETKNSTSASSPHRRCFGLRHSASTALK